jgi:phosphoglycerol transferase MdoB-like AlkP superfamily enzyme
MTPILTIINFYFEKKRGLANGILWSASGISTIVNPTMYRQLIDIYGIHGAMIIEYLCRSQLIPSAKMF